MKRLMARLARPGLHVVAGFLFFVAFAWPFMTFKTPTSTWMFLHVAWIVAVGLLAVLGVADAKAPAEDLEEEGQSG